MKRFRYCRRGWQKKGPSALPAKAKALEPYLNGGFESGGGNGSMADVCQW